MERERKEEKSLINFKNQISNNLFQARCFRKRLRFRGKEKKFFFLSFSPMVLLYVGEIDLSEV